MLIFQHTIGINRKRVFKREKTFSKKLKKCIDKLKICDIIIIEHLFDI